MLNAKTIHPDYEKKFINYVRDYQNYLNQENDFKKLYSQCLNDEEIFHRETRLAQLQSLKVPTSPVLGTYFPSISGSSIKNLEEAAQVQLKSNNKIGSLSEIIEILKKKPSLVSYISYIALDWLLPLVIVACIFTLCAFFFPFLMGALTLVTLFAFVMSFINESQSEFLVAVSKANKINEAWDREGMDNQLAAAPIPPASDEPMIASSPLNSEESINPSEALPLNLPIRSPSVKPTYR